MLPEWIDPVAAFALGALVGAGELVSRYKDEPWRALRTRASSAYLVINGAASVLAVVSLKTFGWAPGSESAPLETRFLQVLAGGLGAMAVFRSSLFVIRVGNSDVGVGPVTFLQAFLSATDRGVDRTRAKSRANAAARIMGNLSFDDIWVPLPSLAIQLMQNLSSEDALAINEKVGKLALSSMSPRMKSVNLGLVLLTYIGQDVLEEAVKTLQSPDAQKPAGQGLLGGLGGRKRDQSAPPLGGATVTTPAPEPVGETALASTTPEVEPKAPAPQEHDEPPAHP